MEINEMAESRKRLLDLIENQAYSIFEHTMKCVLYRENEQWLNDWYKTIGNDCQNINKYLVKGSNSKLDEQDYLDIMIFFDSISDCQNEIDSFYTYNVNTKNEYPQFIDRSNAEALYNIYTGFISLVSKIFATKNNYDNKYFAKLFEDYFKSEISKINEDLTNSKLFDLL